MEEEESREMQVGLVELQECASPGAWEEDWGILWCLGGEEGGQAGNGVQRWEAWEMQGHGHLSLPAQRGRTCKGGNTEHKQTETRRPSRAIRRTRSTFRYTNHGSLP